MLFRWLKTKNSVGEAAFRRLNFPIPCSDSKQQQENMDKPTVVDGVKLCEQLFEEKNFAKKINKRRGGGATAVATGVGSIVNRLENNLENLTSNLDKLDKLECLKKTI
jgi:hypothetical protein